MMSQLRSYIIIIIVLLSSVGLAKGNSYYFSSSTGNDQRTMAESQNPATPWKSIDKLNSILPSLAPGDSILFKRGDTFYGSIDITKSGSGSLPIVFSAYGNGARPIITGLTTLSDWNNAGSGIQEADCPSCEASDNVVIVNGVLQRMGRYPNTGYLTYQSYSGDSSITSDQLPASPDWTGAEVVIRKHHWVLDKNKITGQSGNTIIFRPASHYTGTNNFGFFIQDDPRTLDTLGEWYLDPDNNKMMVYFGDDDPSQYEVKTSTVDTLIYLEGISNITFDNLTLEGADKYGFLVNGSNHITIQDCNINYSGNDAILCANCKDFILTNSSIGHSLNHAVQVYGSTNASITNNIIKNTGYMSGMGGSGTSTYTGVTLGGSNNKFMNNEIDSTGYTAVIFSGNSDVIENNYINTFCFIEDDGGGIYTWIGPTAKIYKERFVKDNIVINGIGAPVGADGTLEVHGIYMDDNTSQVTITGNTIANCNSSGLFVHDGHDLMIDSNIVYNNAMQVELSEDHHYNEVNKLRDIRFAHNILFSKSPRQQCLALKTVLSTAKEIGILDSNYYCMPIDNSKAFSFYNRSNREYQTFSLPGWQSFSSQDTHSKGAPVIIADTSEILFKYNPTTSDKKIFIDGTYIGVDGTHYSNSIILKPFSSIILIKI